METGTPNLPVIIGTRPTFAWFGGFNGDWSRRFEYIRVGWDSTGDLIGQTGFGQFDPLDRERFSSISSRGGYTCALLMDGTSMY